MSRALARAALALVLLAALPPSVDADGVSHPPRSWRLTQLIPSAPGEAPAMPWIDEWLEQPTLLGDVGGLRPALERLGITAAVTWVSDIQGNPIGGRRQAVREFEDLSLRLDVDLEKLLGAPGTRFNATFSNRSGTSLSDIDIGNTFIVAQTCCGATARLAELYLEQPLFGDRVDLRVGRLAAGDEFLASPLYGWFVSNGVNGNPAGILSNAPGFSTYPVTTWGMRARVRPLDQLYVMAGVFNGDPELGENAKHGLDWTMRGPLFAIAEIGYALNQGANATGLPGTYKIGAYYNGGAFEDVLRDEADGLAPLTGLPPRTVTGTTGLYVLADQMVYREGGDASQQGLTAFLAFLLAPDQSINSMPIFLNGGLVYRGLIPRRDNDVAGFALVYGRFSDDLRHAQRLMRRAGVASPIQQYELVLEWTYAIQPKPWLTVQPDVQYIIKPGGSGAVPNALVLGVQLSVSF